MYRRSLLTATATGAAVAVAGCVGDGGTADLSGSDGDQPSDLETAADPDLRSTEITEVDAEAIDEAGVSFTPDAVHVTGTVVGETGCHGVAIDDAAVDDDGEFRVVVAAVDESAPGSMCTQALTTVGYELEATFDDGVPESVTVTHDDAHGRGTAMSEQADGE